MPIPRLAITLLCTIGLAACGDDDNHADGDGSPDNAGEMCEVAEDCYPDLEGDLSGDPVCLDKVEGGYCTHLCETDEDCCAVEGECVTDLPQVCAPFESTGMKMCFLSCEDALVGEQDSNAYCVENAHPRFICRSTGGGAENRRVCVPEG
jgi:hypothetical protein